MNDTDLNIVYYDFTPPPQSSILEIKIDFNTYCNNLNRYIPQYHPKPQAITPPNDIQSNEEKIIYCIERNKQKVKTIDYQISYLMNGREWKSIVPEIRIQINYFKNIKQIIDKWLVNKNLNLNASALHFPQDKIKRGALTKRILELAIQHNLKRNETVPTEVIDKIFITVSKEKLTTCKTTKATIRRILAKEDYSKFQTRKKDY